MKERFLNMLIIIAEVGLAVQFGNMIATNVFKSESTVMVLTCVLTVYIIFCVLEAVIRYKIRKKKENENG